MKDVGVLIQAEAITHAEHEQSACLTDYLFGERYFAYKQGTKSPVRIEQIIRRTLELDTETNSLERSSKGFLTGHLEKKYNSPEEIIAKIIEEITND